MLAPLVCQTHTHLNILHRSPDGLGMHYVLFFTMGGCFALRTMDAHQLLSKPHCLDKDLPSLRKFNVLRALCKYGTVLQHCNDQISISMLRYRIHVPSRQPIDCKGVNV